MKTKLIPILFTALTALFLLPACSTPQAEASAVYVGAEASTAALLQKTPTALPTLKLLVADWPKFESGAITSTDEVALLNGLAQATGKQLSPVQAAALDGAVQQIIANQNATAPTPLQGGAAAIITDLINGVGRELTIYTPPAP